MKYKVGDEVFIKGRIKSIDEGSVFPYLVGRNRLGDMWCNESDIADKAYADGLNDAWELAKKIAKMSCDECRDIFGKGGFHLVAYGLTVEEALAKIEAYEEEKEIKVGDVVHHIGGKTFIVTYIHDDGYVSGITEEGGIYSRVGIGNVVKAGKHIDIESLLRQIGE